MLRGRLKEARKQAGLTQQKMANLLDITVGQYQKYEGGGSVPTVERLLQIADILDVSVDVLLCRDDFLKRHQAES